MSGTAKLTVLCENMVGRVGSGEHGFALFIEIGREAFLFDTGQGRFLLENAAALGKDLRAIRGLFLSHGHDDHTGGLDKVLKKKGRLDVYAHPDVFVDRFRVEGEGPDEVVSYKGIPFKRVYLETLGARFVLNRDFVQVGPAMYLSGEVPRRTSFETLDSRLKRKTGDVYVIDSFSDDQSLVLDTPQGLVIVFGCAHAGMMNIIYHVMAQTGKDRLHGLVGGTHLAFLGREQLETSVRELKKLSPDFVGVSHCTGFRAAATLCQAFGERFRYGHVGAVFEV
jgi:7,8-dihydropterin-6-yl-methyl-4-(beta-D-ribofuranosyl)aminobenzene 5'-phosphate synthase